MARPPSNNQLPIRSDTREDAVETSAQHARAESLNVHYGGDPVFAQVEACRLRAGFVILRPRFLANSADPRARHLTFQAMKFFRQFLAVVCVAPFIASAAEQSAANPKCAALPLLQGTWEGVLVGDALQKKITVTIAGDSLRFHRDRNFWFETTVILPAGKAPQQLHATITGRSPSQPVDAGRVVRAFFKLEDEALTLATMGEDSDETLKSFEASAPRYELRKVHRETKISPLPEPETSDSRSVLPPKQAVKYSQPPKLETDSFRFEKQPKPPEKVEK